MRVKSFFILLVFGVAAAACTAADEPRTARRPAGEQKASQASAAQTKPDEPVRGAAPRLDAHGHPVDSHGHTVDLTNEVPAFVKNPAELRSLPATLSPDQFTGTQRLGYQAVREIPETIAQLPCYCHCDKGFGHKSLHSCFVDNHAAHCAVCIDEALMAYKMEKEDKLTPEQIRQRIVAHYSAKQ
jgi:Protein of unknown function with PCYCGC motif